MVGKLGCNPASRSPGELWRHLAKMFKSTLGLGLGSTKKADLNVSLLANVRMIVLFQAYLRTLEKKNKEVQRKHSLTGAEEVEARQEEETPSEEDSDLLSLKREMQEEQEQSPFIKRTQPRRNSEVEVPEESKVPFISSLAAPSTGSAGVAALNSFVKYDRKWRGGAKLAAKADESETESEPALTEESPHSPVKIVSELEERAFPHQRRRSRSRASPSLPSPSPRRGLRVSIPSLRTRKVSEGSGPTPVPTLSEMSELHLSPHSPLMEVLNVRDISEVLSELEEVEEKEEGGSPNLSAQLVDLTRGENNPFHFRPMVHGMEVKKEVEVVKPVQRQMAVSNRRRDEMSQASSIAEVEEEVREEESEEVEQEEYDATIASESSETIKESVPRKERRRWTLSSPVFQRQKPPLVQDSSVEGTGCYYCR